MMDSHRELVTGLLDKIFAAEVRNFNRQVDQLIDENAVIANVPNAGVGFNHLGVDYGRAGAAGWNFVPLSARLVPRMNRLLRFRKEVAFDRQMITQVLFRLVDPCKDRREIRDTLPECVVLLDDWLAKTYQRMAEPAWTIKDNPRDMKAYEKALPKIETYCAMQLLY